MTDLIPLYRAMAAEGANFHGLSLLSHKDAIGKLIRHHGVETVLDWGCGRGDPYRGAHKVWREWGVKWFDIWLYDPAFPTHDKMPPAGKQFDLVICSDVLEHVPEEGVDEFVSRLFSRAGKAVWASVCTRAAKKFFPDGVTNLHVTQKPLQWWIDTFDQHCGTTPYTLVETP